MKLASHISPEEGKPLRSPQNSAVFIRAMNDVIEWIFQNKDLPDWQAQENLVPIAPKR